MYAREGGLIAFLTSQGVLNSEQNKPIREHLMNTCNVVSAIRLPNNLFTEEAGTEVGSDLIILQKKNSHILPTQRQQDFIDSRKLSNGIFINNLFKNFYRVVHTDVKVGTDPYGKPAMEFTYSGGIDAIAASLYQMLSDGFSKIFDRSIAFNPNEITQTNDEHEALVASLNKYGIVNPDYMVSLTGGIKDELQDGLKGKIYFNPLIGGYEIADKFITGDVISKTDEVDQFYKRNPETLIEESLNALKEAIPKPIAFDDLDFNFGERWIPVGIYITFVSYLFETDVNIHYASSRDEFSINSDTKNVKIRDRFAVKSDSCTFDGIALM